MPASGLDGCGCLGSLLDIGSTADFILSCLEDWRFVVLLLLWIGGGVLLVLLLAYFDVAEHWYYIAVGGYLIVTIAVIWALNVAEVRRLR